MDSSATVSAGFLKIFDEILVNAADNRQRDERRPRLRSKSRTIALRSRTMAGLFPWSSTRQSSTTKDKPVWVPELVFGNMMAGENFDDDELRTVGGQRIGSQAHQHFLARVLHRARRERQEVLSKVARQHDPNGSSERSVQQGQVPHPDQFRSRSHSFRHDRDRRPPWAPCADAPTTLRAVWARASPFGSTRPRCPIPSFAHYTRLASPDAVVVELG